MNKLELEKKIQVETDNKLKIFSMYKKALLSEEETENEMALNKLNIDSYNRLLNEINTKLEDSSSLIQKIDEANEFINKWDELVFTNNFELQHSIIRMFIEKIVIDFDEESEIYTINIRAKLPDSKQFYSYTLDTKGFVAIKNQDFKDIDSKYIHDRLRDNLKPERKDFQLDNPKKNRFEIMPPKEIERHR